MYFCFLSAIGFSNEAPALESFLGVRFGTEINIQNDNETAITFTPKRKFRDFSQYFYLLSPKRKQVYAIGMGIYFNSLNDAVNEAAIVVRAFSDHYKVSPKYYEKDSPKDRIVFEFSNGCTITITVAKLSQNIFFSSIQGANH